MARTAAPARRPSNRPSLLMLLPYILLVGSVVALIASFILSYEKLELLKNPHFVPSCNLNPVISCGNVMASHQADVFGFPNSWIGLAGFSVVITIAVALLAGAAFKRWFWLAFEGGMTLAMVFAYWLLSQSIYVIKALCPYCLTVDVMLTTMFWYLTLHIVAMYFTSLPQPLQRVAAFARRYHLEILVCWFLLVIVLILQHFWYYYGQFI